MEKKETIGIIGGGIMGITTAYYLSKYPNKYNVILLDENKNLNKTYTTISCGGYMCPSLCKPLSSFKYIKNLTN